MSSIGNFRCISNLNYILHYSYSFAIPVPRAQWIKKFYFVPNIKLNPVRYSRVKRTPYFQSSRPMRAVVRENGDEEKKSVQSDCSSSKHCSSSEDFATGSSHRAPDILTGKSFTKFTCFIDYQNAAALPISKQASISMTSLRRRCLPITRRCRSAPTRKARFHSTF
ncbi:hypothetical protein ARMGADRAFT_1070755 [Armillaria gallica]|uniref:Uncharacterized protein n=1 Tax=Armillaria gallica TaxID=47427 RepID=A0A2H3EM88_ARMGA|nr:hypothetical protein ARMGADRAFT_1070755 [Armillaria gallica]